MIIFGDIITKLIVPHQIIKCKEHEATVFFRSEAKVKDIYRQVERICKFWDLNEVENETHFLLQYRNYKDLRKDLINYLQVTLRVC